jgi:hypothetical protein
MLMDGSDRVVGTHSDTSPVCLLTAVITNTSMRPAST